MKKFAEAGTGQIDWRLMRKPEEMAELQKMGSLEKLMEDGLAPDVPVAVIEKASRPDMRVLRGPLAGLPNLIADNRVKSPALIVIGDVTAEPENIMRKLALEAAK